MNAPSHRTQPGSGAARAQQQPEQLSAADRRLAFWLAICVFAVLLPFVHGRFSGTDEVAVYETTRALYERGEPSLGDLGPAFPHIYSGRGGRHYSHFALGQAVLALPFFGVGRAGAALLPSELAAALAGPLPPAGSASGGAASGAVEIFFVTLYGPAATGLLAALFFAFQCRLGVSRRSSLVAAALMAGTTYVAPMSVFFLRHTSEAICILGGLYGFFVYARSGSARAAAFGSALASATFLVRVPAALAGLGIGGYCLWALCERRRRGDDPAAIRAALFAISAPLAAAAALHVATNWWRWGRWLGSPMFDQAIGFVTPIQVGLQGFLVSPGASVFVHAPLLCLLPWLLGDFWRTQRAECAAVVAISLTFLLVCSTYLFWTGLWSAPGPRYVFVIIPLLLLPLGRFLDRQRGLLARGAVALLALAGIFVQLVLLLARWPAVIELMDWQRYGPMMGFVFVASDSPIAGCLRGISRGLIDAWLWVQWTGGPTLPPRPELAIGGALACAGLIAASALVLRRALRQADALERGGGATTA